MIRFICGIAGVGILAAAAHVTVQHIGGYHEPHAALVVAVAAGVAIGAIAIGSAWAAKRYAVAVAIAIALLCGEAFGLLMTAERLIAGRADAQAPMRILEADRTKARAALDRARARLQDAERQTPRLRAAIDAKRQVDRAAQEKSALRGCASNCRKLLQQQTANAAREVEAARKAQTEARRAARADVQGAQTALDRIPASRDTSPLASRLGLPAWALDLIMSALGSIGANGLGAALLAFAGHRRVVPVVTVAPVQDVATVSEPRPTRDAGRGMGVVDPKQHAAKFGVDRLRPANDNRVPLGAIHREYLDWCRSENVDPLPEKEIGEVLSKLFMSAGITIATIDGQPVAVGVRLKTDAITHHAA